MIKKHITKAKQAVKDSQTETAQKSFMEALFNDYYENRAKVYRMNFVRGLFFGFGSVLGGTVVISLAVWLLSFFVDYWVIGDYLRSTQDVLKQSR